jgi:serine/threonine protein kinase
LPQRTGLWSVANGFVLMQELSRYRIKERVGDQNSSVYEAERASDGVAVVMRMLPEVLAHDPAAFKIYQDLLSNLPAHPCLRSVQEAVVDGDITYVVMEKLQGTTLKQRLTRGPMRTPESERLREELSQETGAAPAETAAIPPVASVTPDALEKPATSATPPLIQPHVAPSPDALPSPLPEHAPTKIIIPPGWQPYSPGQSAAPRSTEPATAANQWTWDKSDPPWVEPAPKIVNDIDWDLLSFRLSILTAPQDPRLIAAKLQDALAILTVAIAIAGALESLHEKGIIHGGVNPGAIFLCEEGSAKLIGTEVSLLRILVRPVPGTDARPELDYVPVVPKPESVIDAAAYYSPEQVAGKLLDTRSDIFSFGCVLYEMLQGRRAFANPDVAGVQRDIARRECIIPTTLPATPMPEFHPTILKALERDRGMRYHSAKEMRTALESLRTMFQRRVEDLKPKEPVAQNPVTSTAEQSAPAPPKLGVQVGQDAAEVGNLPHYTQALSHPVLIKIGVSLLVIFVLILLLLLVKLDWH